MTFPSLCCINTLTYLPVLHLKTQLGIQEQEKYCDIIKMKVAVVFLLVALSGCFDAASVPQTNCLQQLLQEDAPLLLQELGSLICDYKVAQAKQNAAMFLAFLQQVNALLAKVGCSINNILGTHVTINLQNAEALGDQVANVLFQFLQNILEKVVNVLDDVPFMGDIVNDKTLIQDIRVLGCEVLADLIADVDKVLKFVSNIVGNLQQQRV
ncbi:uncharacterized protein LOC128491334 [Spea bombifrons]|uniref:uncharacterized protein LOC128491334 n=1 Tax=Spea bombifrons TaxID=233779 RepID=UPI00234A875E|nr:uncharacterized protein LOC128491334 [Spea bombifrons]